MQNPRHVGQGNPTSQCWMDEGGGVFALTCVLRAVCRRQQVQLLATIPKWVALLHTPAAEQRKLLPPHKRLTRNGGHHQERQAVFQDCNERIPQAGCSCFTAAQRGGEEQSNGTETLVVGQDRVAGVLQHDPPGC